MLRRCTVCKGMESGRGKDHEFELDTNIPEWKIWHSFRRLLASNGYELGVKPKVIQAIPRHCDVGTTMSWYVEMQDAEARKALAMMDKWFEHSDDRATFEVVDATGTQVDWSSLGTSGEAGK